MQKLKKLSKLLRCEAGILDDSTHRVSVYGIVPRNGYNPPAVAHNDMLPLSSDVESRLLQSSDCAQVRNAGDLRHGLCRNVDLPQFMLAGQFLCDL